MRSFENVKNSFFGVILESLLQLKRIFHHFKSIIHLYVFDELLSIGPKKNTSSVFSRGESLQAHVKSTKKYLLCHVGLNNSFYLICIAGIRQRIVWCCNNHLMRCTGTWCVWAGDLGRRNNVSSLNCWWCIVVSWVRSWTPRLGIYILYTDASIKISAKICERKDTIFTASWWMRICWKFSCCSPNC